MAMHSLHDWATTKYKATPITFPASPIYCTAIQSPTHKHIFTTGLEQTVDIEMAQTRAHPVSSLCLWVTPGAHLSVHCPAQAGAASHSRSLDLRLRDSVNITTPSQQLRSVIFDSSESSFIEFIIRIVTLFCIAYVCLCNLKENVLFQVSESISAKYIVSVYWLFPSALGSVRAKGWGERDNKYQLASDIWQCQASSSRAAEGPGRIRGGGRRSVQQDISILEIRRSLIVNFINIFLSKLTLTRFCGRWVERLIWSL